MRIVDLESSDEPVYSHRLSIYLDNVEEDDRGEIAGMLRGLMCAVDGWGRIAGLTNVKFDDGPVIVTFSSADKADHFRRCVKYYFDDQHLEALKVRRRLMKG